MANLIGIEINSSAVKMAQLNQNSAVLITKNLPDELVGEENKNPDKLGKFIRSAKSHMGFKGNKCCVLLPDQSTFFRSIQQPLVTAEQLALSLPYEFKDYVGENSADYSYDYAVEDEVLDENGKVEGFNILAGAAQLSTLDLYEDILKKAGLKLTVALPREMAVIKLIKKYGIDDPDRAYCVLDLGFEHTRIYIFKEKSLRASKIIDLGCASIDSLISEKYGVGANAAAGYRDENKDDIWNSEECKAIYDKVSVEVMKTVNFFSYEHAGMDFGGIYFCGSGAKIAPFTKTIVNQIGIEALDIKTLLPESCAGSDVAAECAMAAGLIV